MKIPEVTLGGILIKEFINVQNVAIIIASTAMGKSINIQSG